MRYLTKDWYNKMQAQDMHILLKINKKAESFSEKFYKKIYKIKLKEYIKNETIISNYKKFKKFILENNDHNEYLDEIIIKEKYEKYKKDLFLGKEPGEAFDYIQSLNIAHLKDTLPNNIIKKVKDIRVLALDYVSKEVYELIKDFCEENAKFVNNKFEEYLKIQNEIMKDDSLEFFNTSFHDCYIEKIENNNKDLSISFITGGLTENENIIFKNFKIKLDENINNSIWLYEEIYKVKNKYEIHILTIKDDILKEMIIECDDINIK